MQSRAASRVFPFFAVAGAAALAALTSCSDASRPTTLDNDEWAQNAVVNLRMRAKITQVAPDGPKYERSFSSDVSTPVLRGQESSLTAALTDAKGGGGRTQVRHFRDRAGRLNSIGFFFDRPGMPPKFVYTFVDGRIQSIASAVYERHGKGFIRTGSRVTIFGDDGTPRGQIDLASDRLAAMEVPSKASRFNAAAAAAIKDVARVFVPRDLYAQEYSWGCLAEYILYIAASVTLAAANTALAFTLAGCPTAGIPCLALPTALAGMTAALTAWNGALDKLLACEEKRKAPEAGGDSDYKPGGGDGGGSDDWGNPPDASSAKDVSTVKDFIERAISSGNFWCSADGDYCIYYAT